jgi:transposase-like protein
VENNSIHTESAYWSSEIAEILGVAPVTLRKWSQELEKHGWRFVKDAQDRRAYTDRDAIALRYLRDLMRDRRTSLESAVQSVINRYGIEEPEEISLPDIQDRQREKALAVQSEAMQRLNDLTLAVQQLTERVDQIVQEQVRNEIAAAREQIAAEIASISEQMNVQTAQLSEKIDTVITETRAERHRKKPWWKLW